MRGINRHRKGIDRTWAALRTIRTARPDGAPIYVILDNLSAHLNWRIRRWATRNKVELCFTPTYASWANPIEAQFGPLRQCTLADSTHPNHTAQTRALHAYPRWRRTPTTPTTSQNNDANAPESAARKAPTGAANHYNQRMTTNPVNRTRDGPWTGLRSDQPGFQDRRGGRSGILDDADDLPQSEPTWQHTGHPGLRMLPVPLIHRCICCYELGECST